MIYFQKKKKKIKCAKRGCKFFSWADDKTLNSTTLPLPRSNQISTSNPIPNANSNSNFNSNSISNFNQTSKNPILNVNNKRALPQSFTIDNNSKRTKHEDSIELKLYDQSNFSASTPKAFQLKEDFKVIKGARYQPQSKQWIFPITSHNEFIEFFTTKKKMYVSPLPSFLLDSLKKIQKNPNLKAG